MRLVDFVFWGLLLAALILLAVGYPEGRRSAWGVALLFGLIDLCIVGYQVMQK